MPAPQYVPLKFQPGVWKNGTLYQAQGRWFDADLMRWSVGALGPMGGWRPWGENTVAVTNVPRTTLAWTDNSFRRWIAVGTYANLYIYDHIAGLSDITPVGFTEGREDANPNVGYGNAIYGTSTYGDPRPDLGIPEPATTWSLALWGEDLVGCTPDDGDVYLWDASTATPATAVGVRIANSPQFATATSVTGERIQMVFGGVPSGGAEGDRDRRRIFWSDSEDNTDWTASSTNQAGDHNLETDGDLLGAVKIRDKLLIFTTIDAHTATYVGLPYVYTFDRVGEACGPVCINAVAVAGPTAYWMGRSAQGFFMFDGYVRPIPCDVESFLVTEMNQAQSSKVVAWHNTLFNEIYWFYPGSSTEVDSYISYNYLEKHWSVGTMARSAVMSRGIFLHPILFDTNGHPYEHEVGNSYEDTGAAVALGSNPVATTSTSNAIIQVTDPGGHGTEIGNTVRLGAATAVGGITAARINVEMTVASVPTSTTFTADLGGSNASSVATGGGSNVTAIYTAGPTFVPYVESGPIQLGNGDRVLSATSLIPDVTALGDITTTFYTRMYPTDSDTTHGPFTMAAPTSVRFTGRTCRMRATSDSAAAWNLGIPRLEMQPGGRR